MHGMGWQRSVDFGCTICLFPSKSGVDMMHCCKNSILDIDKHITEATLKSGVGWGEAAATVILCAGAYSNTNRASHHNFTPDGLKLDLFCYTGIAIGWYIGNLQNNSCCLVQSSGFLSPFETVPCIHFPIPSRQWKCTLQKARSNYILIYRSPIDSPCQFYLR